MNMGRRRRKSYSKRLDDIIRENVNRPKKVPRPPARDFRTRIHGTERQIGQHFPTQGGTSTYKEPPMKVVKIEHRPTAWEKIAEEDRKREEAYKKEQTKLLKEKAKYDEIKQLTYRCRVSDPAKRAIARAEFQKKYPVEFAEWDAERKKKEAEKKEKKVVEVPKPVIVEKKEEPKEDEVKITVEELEEAADEIAEEDRLKEIKEEKQKIVDREEREAMYG